MRRFLIFAIAGLAGLVLITAGVAFYLLNDDDFLKSQLNSIVLKQTGRALTVNGPLKLQLGRVVRIEAEDLHFQNAPWAADADMVRVGRLTLAVDIPSIFESPVLIPLLRVEDCDIRLLENESGEANWDLKIATDVPPQSPPPEKAPPPVEFEDVAINNCALYLNGPTREQALQAQVGRLEMQVQDNGHRHVSGAGNIDGYDLTIEGWYGPKGTFYTGEPLEHDLLLTIGETRLESSGRIEETHTMGGANLHFRLNGPEIARVLKTFAMPPVSEGPFDFRVELQSQGDQTHLQLNGDLGSLQAHAEGNLDQLLKPANGTISGSISGPNLESLGQAFGLEGLVPDAFDLIINQALFEEGLVKVEQISLETPSDRLDVSGHLGTENQFANTKLDFRLDSKDPGRWAGLLKKPLMEIGPVTATGTLSSDADALFSTVATLQHGQSSLELSGALGPLAGPFQPELTIDFHSDDLRQLASLAGVADFPNTGVSAKGFLGIEEKHIKVDQLQLGLDGLTRVMVNGQLNLGNRFAGSDIDLELDVVDLQTLGRLFGKDDLPAQAVQLSSTLKPDGKGLSFDVRDGNLGDIQLELEGDIKDLDQPLAIDAQFDIRLPSLQLLGFLVPRQELPDLPFTASGGLRNEKAITRVDKVQMQLGSLYTAVDGSLGHDETLKLSVSAKGQDASWLDRFVGMELPPEPYAISTRLNGSFKQPRLDDLQLKLGASEAHGHLELGLDEAKQISGELISSNLDIGWLMQKAQDQKQAKPEATSREWVFNDTPVFRIGDYGIEADLRIKVARVDLGNSSLKDIDLGVLLIPHFLELKPLSLRGKTGGAISGLARVDARGGKPVLHFDIQAQEMKLGLMVGENQSMDSYPSTNLKFNIDGEGATYREMASNLNGKIRLQSGPGQIASAGIGFLLSDFLTELFSTLNPFVKNSEYTNFDCSVLAADIVSGQVTLNPVIANTEQLTILSGGTIDLDTEKLDLSFSTRPRQGLGISAGAIINPFIKVGGRMVSPAVELDPERAVISSSLAVATVGMSLLAKSMSDRFLTSKDPCGDALKEIAKRDKGQ